MCGRGKGRRFIFHLWTWSCVTSKTHHTKQPSCYIWEVTLRAFTFQAVWISTDKKCLYHPVQCLHNLAQKWGRHIYLKAQKRWSRAARYELQQFAFLFVSETFYNSPEYSDYRMVCCVATYNEMEIFRVVLCKKEILQPRGLHCWLPVSTDLFDHCILSLSFTAYPQLPRLLHSIFLQWILFDSLH